MEKPYRQSNVKIKQGKWGIKSTKEHCSYCHSEDVILFHVSVSYELWFTCLEFFHSCTKINKVQKKAVRIMSKVKVYNAHSEPLFKELNITKFVDNVKVNILKLYCRLEKQVLPVYFTLIVRKCYETHHYNTRTSTKFKTEKSRLAMTTHSLRCQMPIILNNIDQSILDMATNTSVSSIISTYKKKLLVTYTGICQIEDCYICNHN